MRVLMAAVVLLLILATSSIVGATGAEADDPDKIKVTLATDQIHATEDGVYRVTLATAGSSGFTTPSMPAPDSEAFSLTKGDPVAFSRALSFTAPEFIWELTVTPPAQTAIDTRPLILRGIFPPPDVADLISPTGQASPKLFSSPYLKSQPPSDGLEIGTTPIKMILSLFRARMNVCSGLKDGFEEGEYGVTVWMDANDNQQREPREVVEEVAQPDTDGKLCKLVERSSFVEAVNFEFSFVDPQGLILGPATGSYNYATHEISGQFPGAPVHWMGVGFDASTNDMEVKLTSPFTAHLTVGDIVKTPHDPKDLCAATPPVMCPPIGVPDEQIQPTDDPSQWETISQSYAYIPLVAVIVLLLLALVLQGSRGRKT